MSKIGDFIKKHKNIFIAVVVIAAALSAAWFYGGNNAKPGGAPTTSGSSIETSSPSADPTESTGVPPSGTIATTEDSAASPTDGSGGADETTPPSGTEPPAVTQNPTDPPVTDNPATTSPDPTGSATTNPPETTAPPTSPPATTTTPEPTQGKYNTDPVPDGQPQPVEPQDVTVGDGSFTVTLTVRCDTLLNNMNRLNKEKHELVPADGVIFATTTVTVYEGESVFNVLQRTMKQNKIHMAFRNTPIYNSAYIEAINNLYEFDAGDLSGWMYCVNGWYPNYGCSRYQLKPGDVIEWNYTCDLGRDLGQEWIGGGGQGDD